MAVAAHRLTVDTDLPNVSRHLAASAIALKWQWDAKKHCVVSSFRLEASAEGLPGHIHGGALAAICDEAMGWACWCNGYVAAGARIQTEFKVPVRSGQLLLVSACVDAVDGRKLTTSAWIAGEAGNPTVVAAEGLYVAITPKDWSAFAGWPGLERFVGGSSAG